MSKAWWEQSASEQAITIGELVAALRQLPQHLRVFQYCQGWEGVNSIALMKDNGNIGLDDCHDVAEATGITLRTEPCYCPDHMGHYGEPFMSPRECTYPKTPLDGIKGLR